MGQWFEAESEQRELTCKTTKIWHLGEPI